VLQVAIRTNGDIFYSFYVIQTMDALEIILLDTHMTLSTGINNFFSGSFSLRIFNGEDVVATMAMGTVG